MKIKTMVRNTELPPMPPSVGDISVQRLIDDSLLALSREVKNLLVMSAKGKLAPTDARDLRDHLKLLFELKDRESDLLRGLTDEQLKELVDIAHAKHEDTPGDGQ